MANLGIWLSALGLAAKDVELLEKWINGGVLETKSSVAKKSSKPKLELNVAAGTGRPEGPIAKPENVLLEPVVVTPRTTAVTAMAASPWINLVGSAWQQVRRRRHAKGGMIPDSP